MKRIPRELRPIIIVAAIFVVVMLAAPTQGQSAGAASWEYLKEMALILPPVFFLIAYSVWVPRSMVEKHLGQKPEQPGSPYLPYWARLQWGLYAVPRPHPADKGTSLFIVVVFLTMGAANTHSNDGSEFMAEFALRLGRLWLRRRHSPGDAELNPSPQVPAQPSARPQGDRTNMEKPQGDRTRPAKPQGLALLGRPGGNSTPVHSWTGSSASPDPARFGRRQLLNSP